MAALTRVRTKHREIAVGIGAGLAGLVIGIAVTAAGLIGTADAGRTDAAAPTAAVNVLPPAGLDGEIREALENAVATGSTSVLPPADLNDRFRRGLEATATTGSSSVLPPADLDKAIRAEFENASPAGSRDVLPPVGLDGQIRDALAR